MRIASTKVQREPPLSAFCSARLTLGSGLLMLLLSACIGSIAGDAGVSEGSDTAVDSGGAGEFDGGELASDGGSVLDGGFSFPPTSLVATIHAPRQVTLRWVPPPVIAASYAVYRWAGSTPIELLASGITTTQYTDGTVTPGTRYSYRVQAFESGTAGALSNIASIFVSPATQLFRSSFSGITLEAPSSLTALGAWQRLTGIDSETKYAFPISGLGSNFTGLQLIGPAGKGGTPLTADNVSQFFENSISAVVGPHGDIQNALRLMLAIKEEPVGDARSQIPFLIQRPWTIGDAKNIYISYWYRFPNQLADLLDADVPAGNWRVLFEWKTGGFANTYKGDFRMKTLVWKRADGVLAWSSSFDNEANMSNMDVPSWAYTRYWTEVNANVPVPVGQWFKVEVFWRRSSGADGWYWVAVNGQTITNHQAPNMGDYNLPITRIMVNNAYSGGRGPVEGFVTDLQVWDGFPCGDGVSCPP